MIKRWIGSNILFLIFLIFWSYWTQEFISPIILMSKTAGIFSVCLIVINFNMYFIFLMIRKSKRKDVKKRLASFSRKFMKGHVHIGITATALALFHIYFMLTEHPIDFLSFKKISGYLVVFGLGFQLFSGWLRRKKASGFRRKFHQRTAFFFIVLIFIHIIL